MPEPELFDTWPERYEAWFKTPIGALVRNVEIELVLRLVASRPGELLLDAGCGTGVFTTDFVASGSRVVGLDISRPMLRYARTKDQGASLMTVQADMRALPFNDQSFDGAVSITALEFVAEARDVIDELFRVTKPGGLIVVATLNSLSTWAERRNSKTASGQRHVLENAHYRSGEDLLALSECPGTTLTAVHFDKDDDPVIAAQKEREGREQSLTTGAFVAARWQKSPG